MAQYQKIEYRIGNDGKVTETVLGASGSSCTQTTAGIEQSLGRIEEQQLLPEYYDAELLTESIEPPLQQWRGEDG